MKQSSFSDFKQRLNHILLKAMETISSVFFKFTHDDKNVNEWIPTLIVDVKL